MVQGVLFVIAVTIAAILAARRGEDNMPQTRMEWARTIAYWLFTILVAFEMVAGAMWDFLRIEYVRVVLAHLGYPMYLLFILGAWRVPGGLVLLLPRFPRIKEWAYAGAIFDYTGAAASHLFMRDSAGTWIAPLILAVFTIASWALRPGARRLPRTGDASTTVRPVAWLVPVLITVAIVVFALLNLPKGAPSM